MNRFFLLAALAAFALSPARAQVVPQLVVAGDAQPYADNLTLYDGRLFFTLRVPGNGVDELWAYSEATGTASRVVEGSVLGTLPTRLTACAGRLYYVARMGSSTNLIRAYDAATGTVSAAVTGSGTPTWLTCYRDRLYYTRFNTEPIQVYDPATGASASAYAESLRSPMELQVYDDRLFFTAGNGLNDAGNELRVFDADTGAATLVADIAPGTASSVPINLVVIEGRLHFVASPGGPSTVYTYDAATGTTAALGTPGQPPLNPREPTLSAGQIYAQGSTAETGSELWRFDPGGTATLVADIAPGASSGQSRPSSLVDFDGRLFFVANDGTTGFELWVYDGASGAARVADLRPGPLDGVLGSGVLQEGRKALVAYGGRLFFGGYDGTPGGGGLWAVRAMGTAAEPGAAAGLSFAVAPNPARGPAAVTLTLDAVQSASVAVYDVLGRRVAVLHDGPLAAGVTALSLDASPLPAGVYVVRLAAGTDVRTTLLTVVR